MSTATTPWDPPRLWGAQQMPTPLVVASWSGIIETVHTHAESIEVPASPEAAYDLVSAVDRTPELSREVRRIEWLGELHSPVADARFRGRNRWLGFVWWREVHITVAERGREFTFHTVPGRGIYHDSTTWTYRFEPVARGTLITETYAHSAPVWLDWMDRLLGRRIALARGMRRTLENIRAQVPTETMIDRTADSS